MQSKTPFSFKVWIHVLGEVPQASRDGAGIQVAALCNLLLRDAWVLDLCCDDFGLDLHLTLTAALVDCRQELAVLIVAVAERILRRLVNDAICRVDSLVEGND